MSKFLVVKEWEKYSVVEDIEKLKESLSKDGILTDNNELILAEIDDNGEFRDFRSYDERDEKGNIIRPRLGLLQKYDVAFDHEELFQEKLTLVEN